jgi:hypothetical protein
MKRLTTTFAAAMLITATLLAQSAAPKIFKRDTGASTYHLADCAFTKSSGYVMVPATIDEVLSSKLSACTICHPERNPDVVAAVAAAKAAAAEAAAAAERATAAKAKAEGDARAATAKAAADAKAADAAAELKRLENTRVMRLTNLRLRPVVTAALNAAKNDVAAFDQKIKDSLATLAPDYRGPVSLVETAGLSVTATGPVARMHMAAREAVRKSGPMPAVTWTEEIQIAVSPSRADSPDIQKVLVERNGVAVAPIRSTLQARELTNARGAKARVNAGDVVFPIAAFNNGAGVTVKITLVPASGASIVRTLNSIALRGLQ